MSEERSKVPERAAQPPMQTRRVALRPITDRDRLFVYELMTDPRAGGRVRFGGATPSPEKVAASLWDSVLAQFVVEKTSRGEPIGVVAVTSPNFRNGFAYLSAVGTAQAQGSGLVAEAVLLGFNYAFRTWPLRKIYMESTEESFHEFRTGTRVLFEEEGRLREHQFWNGRYQDMLILAVYRRTWEKHLPRFSKLLATNPELQIVAR